MNKEKEHFGRQKQMRIKDSNCLSSLPDSVLIEILSRLGAKEMIQTCVLSKRWKKLWTFVPCLDFFNYEETIESENQFVEKLENLVNMALRLRDNASDLYTLYSSALGTEAQLEISRNVALGWILYALNHNTKDLFISLFLKGPIFLPDCLFTCKSLETVYVHLGMEEGKVEIKPDKVWLPRLKDISLGCASFNGDYMAKVLIGCPILESLCLLDCNLEMDNISFRNLKNLVISDCCFVSEGHPSTACISAPGLEFLKFKGEMGSRIKLEDMSTVTEAMITIQDHYIETGIDYNLELLSSLSGVEKLQIQSIYYLKDTLIGELPTCRTFNNLKHLTLGEGCMYCDFHMVLSFLNHCPNLELLTLLHRDADYEDKYMGNELGPEQIECSRLKKIDIFYTTDDYHVDRLMRVLLNSICGINDIKITFSNHRPGDFSP